MTRTHRIRIYLLIVILAGILPASAGHALAAPDTQTDILVYRAGQNAADGGLCSNSGGIGGGDLTDYPVSGVYTFTGWDYFVFQFDFGESVFVDEVEVVQSSNAGDHADGMKVCYSDTGLSGSWVEADSAATALGSNTLSFTGSAHRYWVVRSSGTQQWTLVNSIDFTGLDVNVWRIGNYLQDDSLETATLFDNTFFSPWDSDPAFSQSLSSNWDNGDLGPVCDNRFRVMKALINTPLVVGDPATIYSPTTPPDKRSTINQSFLWYGGPMFVSFAFVTDAEAELSVSLTGPFGEYIPLDDGLTNNTDEWEAWYGNTDSLILGQYSLAIQVTGGDGSPAAQAAIDAVSVSEADHSHCEYQVTVNNAPPDEVSKTLRSQTFVGSEGNLIDNSEFNETGGEVTNWFLPTRGSAYVPNSQAGPNAGYVALFTGAPALMQKTWIQTIYELPVADSRGWLTGQAFGLIGKQLFISFMAVDVAEHMAHQVITLKNEDTGEVFTLQDPDSYEPVAGTTWAKVTMRTLDLTPGRYRLQFKNPYPWVPGANERTIYLDKVCVGKTQFVIAPECSMDAAEVLQVLNDVNFANEQAAAAQATAIAGATLTAYYGANATQVAAQATAYSNAQHSTQTQLVAVGNTTAIARATQTQRANLTSTPIAALTSTAFVQNFHATMTAQSVGTVTRAAQIYATLTQISANRGTATANAATQVGYQATLFSQQTAGAQLTQQVQHVTTLVVNSTNQVNTNATIQPLVTAYAATQYAAQTQLAAAADATTIYQATNAAAVVATANALATGQTGLQLTQQSQLTAAPGQAATIQFQATQIAQQYATVLPTLQAVATQQTLQLPADQPRPDTFDVGCSRPTNALNLAWWIDYEVCRVLWFFTPNQENVDQLQQIATQAVGFEPWGTMFELNNMQEELQTEMEAYNWYETGQDGSQDNVTLIESDFSTPIPGGPVLIPLATTVPILMGDVNFGDPGLNYVFSLSCELRLEKNIGPYLTPPICFLIDITRQTGLLPIARIAFDLGAIMILIKWASRSMADFAGDPMNQDHRSK